MKTSLIALFLMTSAAAFANEAGDDLANRASFAGEHTRAEVKADTMAAKNAGTLGIDEYASQQQPAAQGQRSRGELRAEAVQAARTHKIHELF